jgi:hypothetical protein
MDIEFGGQFDRRVFYRAVALANMPSRKWHIFRLASVALMLILLAVFVTASLIGREPDVYRIARSSVSAGIACFLLLLPYIDALRIAARLWRSASVRQRLVGRITGHGVVYGSSTEGKEYPWESFASLRKSRDVAVLVTADGTMAILPRSFFASDGDWARFQKLADIKVVEAR